MAKGNPRDPERERGWRRHLRQQRVSRLSVRDYCELHRLHESAFYFWRREIAARDRQRHGAAGPTTRAARRRRAAAATGRAEPAFVSVTLIDPPTPRDAAILDIRLANGHRLRVRAGCDLPLLTHLIALL